MAKTISLAAIMALLAVAPATAADTVVMLPVPTHSIYPGDTITENALTERGFSDFVVRRLAPVDARSVLVGKVARRTLLPGQPVPANAIEDPKLVTRGVPAQVVFLSGGLSITAIVSPLESASVGQLVRARNLDSGVTVVGTVQVDGTIRVGDLTRPAADRGGS